MHLERIRSLARETCAKQLEALQLVEDLATALQEDLRAASGPWSAAVNDAEVTEALAEMGVHAKHVSGFISAHATSLVIASFMADRDFAQRIHAAIEQGHANARQVCPCRSCKRERQEAEGVARAVTEKLEGART